MNVLGKNKIVLLGMMSRMPVAGVVWQVVHYLAGLERLGYEAYYVEAHRRTPTMFMRTPHDDATARAAAFIGRVMERFGFTDRWCFHALHEPAGRCYGLSESRLKALYRDAAALINLHGGTEPLPEHAANGRLIYLETDPVALQIELFEKNPQTIAFLEPHRAFFTFGENYGRPDCGLPVCDRFAFRPTRQPVVLDFWEGHGGNDPSPEAFTTIGNWQQTWQQVVFKGEVYHWSKHYEFLKFLDLPAQTGQPFELALSAYGNDDRRMLVQHGWRVRGAMAFSGLTDGDDGPAIDRGIDAYRRYVAGSRGEFTVAKDQNVRLRSGWFSDRSATYLAAARPVVTQDTGFGNALPTGQGLFAFSSLDEAADAIGQINADYPRHRRAALDLARGYFSHDVVLPPILREVGL